MSHDESTVEPESKPARSRRSRAVWWLLTALVIALAVVVWSRSSRLDPRLVGEWTFLNTDGTGIRSFLTLSRNGTATLERIRPGSTERTPDTAPMNWWMEGDVLVTENVADPVTRANQFAADTIAFIRRREREDRAAFRLKVLYVDEKRLRISEVTTPPDPPLEVEMTRVEDSKSK